MKTSGALWKQYLESWPEGQWYDDSDESIGGIFIDDIVDRKIADADVVEFSCGVVFSNERDTSGISLTTHFAKWKKSLSFEQRICNVPKERLPEFDAFLKTIKAESKKT